MTIFIIYLLSIIAYNATAWLYYKTIEKYLDYEWADVILSFIPILNTVFSIKWAIDLYKELYR